MWKQKVFKVLGPDLSKYLKCGHSEGFQTAVIVSTPLAIFSETCTGCGFIQLYSPDAIAAPARAD